MPALRYGLLLLAGLLLYALTPGERILGDGVKIVLVHVSLVWVGALGILLAGLLSLPPRFRRWAPSVARLGLLAYVLGISMSMVAAEINWGGIQWNEPRLRAAFRFIAIALIVEATCGLVNKLRLQALLRPPLAVFLGWSTFAPRLQMHPGRAIKNAEATEIKWAFAAWVIYFAVLSAHLLRDSWRWSRYKEQHGRTMDRR